MADNVIGIKFGVAGGKSLSGESGSLIKSQLEAIASKINLKVNVDRTHFSKQLDVLKKDLEKKLGNLNININTNTAKSSRSGTGSSGTGKAGKEAKGFAELQAQLHKLYTLKLQVAKLDQDSVAGVKAAQQLEVQNNLYEEQKKLALEKKTISEQEEKKLAEQQEKLKSVLTIEQERLRTAKSQKAQTEEQTKIATPIVQEKLLNKAQSLYSDNGFDDVLKRSAQAQQMVDTFYAKVQSTLGKEGGATAIEVRALNKEFIEIETQLKKIGVETDTLGNKLKDTFQSKIIQTLAYAIVGILTRAMSQVYSNIVEIDSAITDLQIATGKTRDETEKLVTSYAKLAKELGATVTEITSAADTWLRQGYDVAETNQLITNTLMLAKLGQIEAADAAKALTSAMKGYKVEVADSIGIVDKFTAVDMEAAVSAGDIATAMAETAASADVAGVSMDKLIGYIATVAEVTQDGAESVGTFYKTLFARMGNVAAGVDIDEEGESLSDVETVLNSLGFTLRDSMGEFRNFGTVLDEVAAKWEHFTSVEQHQIATAFAGTRQQEKFIVLMENYGAALDYASTAASSSGTAEDKYTEAYLNSLEAKLDSLTAAWQSFSQNFLDTELVKGAVSVLTGIVTALDWIVSNVNILQVAISLLLSMGITTAVGKIAPLLQRIGASIKNIGVSIKTAFGKSFKQNLKATCTELQKTKVALEENNEGFEDLAKNTDYTADALKNHYKQAINSGDATQYYADATTLTVEQQSKLNELGKQQGVLMGQQAAQTAQLTGQLNALATSMSLVAGVGTMVISILSGFENTGAQITTIVVSIAVILGITIPLIVKLVKTGVQGIKAALNSLNSIPIIAIITAILTAIMALINAITWLCQADERAKEAAQENAEALQEEADALREVSDAAKEASDGISELIDEIKELTDEMSNADWYHYLDELGGSINDLYGDEELSSLQAINKLLGTAYTYDELMRMSTEERLALLDKINNASIEETRNQQRATYEAQKAASTATVQAEGMKEKVKTDGSYVVDEFLDEIYAGNEEGINLYNTGGKNLKIEIDSENAKDFVEKVQKITDAYEDKYKYNLGALQSNDIYMYFADALAKGKEALQTQTADALNYLNSTVQVAGMQVSVDLNAEDLEAEYNRVLEEISNAVKKDATIDTALTEGVLEAANITEYATAYIATNYEDLYNAVNKSTEGIVVALKDLVDILEEVQDEYDLLVDAMDEMSDTGILSANTIKKIKEEFHELMEYLQETANGYTLLDGALSKYMNTISQKYMDDVKAAQEYFDKIYAEYEASSDKSVEAYEKVVAAQKTLNNAISNAKNWQIVEATLEREGLQQQYTDMLEEQSDALDEQCEKYKDLCEIRKDLLETYQEEIDAQKELEQKQRSVADLQTQLALAKLDKSASGQARARELESQLQEAQDELDEYTLEQAIEDICADIDDAMTEYEEFINSQIEAIEAKIESIVSMSTADIVTAIKEGGETPVSSEDTEEGVSSSGDTYNNAINSASDSAGKTISEATTAPKKEEEKEPVWVTSGKLTSGVSIGSGLSGLSDNARKNDDVDVTIDGKTFDLLAGDVVSSSIVGKLNQLNGGSGKAGDIVAYDGKLYIFDKKGDWRKMADDWDSADSAAAKYLTKLNEQESHHTGGFAGNVTSLRSNEVFAKLLKGELVSTPQQMDRFINSTLPNIINASSGAGANIQNNSPLIEIHCGDVYEDTMPVLKDLVTQAVEKIEQNMKSALSRTGYRK